MRKRKRRLLRKRKKTLAMILLSTRCNEKESKLRRTQKVLR